MTGAYSGTQGMCTAANRGSQGVQGLCSGADMVCRGGDSGRHGIFIRTGVFTASSVKGNLIKY